MTLNLPNRLTLLRIALVPVYMLVLMWDFPFHYLLSGLVFGAAALTDLFDGRIARERGLITNLGKFLDPIADKMLTTAAFVGLMTTGQMNAWALLLIMTREFAVSSVRLMAASSGKVIAADMFGKIKTVAQFVAILCSTAALEFASWQEGILSAFSIADAWFAVPLFITQCLLWVATALTVLSGINYLWQNRHFFREGE